MAEIKQQLYRPAEAAEMLGVAPHTLKYWRRMWERDHRGPAWVTLDNRRIMYPLGELEAYLRSLKPAAGAPYHNVPGATSARRGRAKRAGSTRKD